MWLTSRFTVSWFLRSGCIKKILTELTTFFIKSKPNLICLKAKIFLLMLFKLAVSLNDFRSTSDMAVSSVSLNIYGHFLGRLFFLYYLSFFLFYFISLGWKLCLLLMTSRIVQKSIRADYKWSLAPLQSTLIHLVYNCSICGEIDTGQLCLPT